MHNISSSADLFALPPLPEYTLKLQPDLLPPIPDKLLTVFGPIVAYWALSLFFHWIDINDYFPQYRLHTPVEVAKRNRVTRWEVIRDVVIQQVVQTIVGYGLGLTEPDDYVGKEQYDIAVWARRIRMAQRAIPKILAIMGINVKDLAGNIASHHPVVAGALLGGQYASLESAYLSKDQLSSLQGFTAWETTLASIVYWYLVPSVQFAIAIVVVDTWQYFLHRAMHMNKWLYTTFHSRHHRLYVPYAYGALYNHPFEGFLLDTLGASIAFKVAGLSTRQGLCFFTGCTFKTVDDHCGYALPWDPLQHITGNNAGYHDVHHQSWGVKTNFSQPFFTFWDRILGTVWTGGDVSARYEKSKLAAQKAYDADVAKPITGSDAKDSNTQNLEPYQGEFAKAESLKSIPKKDQQPAAPEGKAEAQATGSRQQILDDGVSGGPETLIQEAREEREAQAYSRPSIRQQTRSSFSMQADDALRGLQERIPRSRHGRTGSLLGMDHGH